jgi:SAM-dependent methyltransferase
MSKEFASQQYDDIYSTGGIDGIYDLPYWHSGYYPLFKAVWRTLAARGSRSVLEVGCGSGGFAHLALSSRRLIGYRGFDFSAVAVQRATVRTRRPELFFVGDARQPSSYEASFDTIVCTEVLEHIEADIDVVSAWPSGTYCVCSVPNFDADNHVRFFRSIADVRRRYGALIDIEHVAQIKKPFLSDLSWRSRARSLIWNRYRPRRLQAIMGLASFEELGGWYVFSGVKRTAGHASDGGGPPGLLHVGAQG